MIIHSMSYLFIFDLAASASAFKEEDGSDYFQASISGIPIHLLPFLHVMFSFIAVGATIIVIFYLFIYQFIAIASLLFSHGWKVMLLCTYCQGGYRHNDSYTHKIALWTLCTALSGVLSLLWRMFLMNYYLVVSTVEFVAVMWFTSIRG